MIGTKPMAKTSPSAARKNREMISGMISGPSVVEARKRGKARLPPRAPCRRSRSFVRVCTCGSLCASCAGRDHVLECALICVRICVGTCQLVLCSCVCEHFGLSSRAVVSLTQVISSWATISDSTGARSWNPSRNFEPVLIAQNNTHRSTNSLQGT